MSNNSNCVKQNISLTEGSGLQEPTRGSGGTGAPSSNKGQSDTGTVGSEFRIISAVSYALFIVDLITLV